MQCIIVITNIFGYNIFIKQCFEDFLNRNRLKRDDCKSLVNFVSISLTKKKSNAYMDKVVTFIVTSKLQKDLLDKQTD